MGIRLSWEEAPRWMHFTYVCQKCGLVWEVGSMMWPSAGRCPLDYQFAYSVASNFVAEVNGA